LLQHFSWDEYTILKKARANSREIQLKDFIISILITNTGKDAAKVMGISPQTFNRTIRKLFPNVKLAGGAQTWKQYLLACINYKFCSTCRLYYPDINFYSTNTGKCKECSKESFKDWYINNREHHQHLTNLRVEKIRKATPIWANLDTIKEIYKNRPEGYHVDHIIPLQGTKVCGLHVENNLQYLLAKDNLVKGNKYQILEDTAG